MKTEDLYRAITEIDDEIIKNTEIKNKSKIKYIKIISLVASFIFVATVFFRTFNIASLLGFSYVRTLNLSPGTTDLMNGFEKQNIKIEFNDENQNIKVQDFALNMLKENYKDGENTLLSPLSIITALGMTANGADNQTLTEMENVLGFNVDELNNYLLNYNLPSTEKCEVDVANSIWIRDTDEIIVHNEFLQTNKNFYDASIYTALFDDSTKKDINNWVNNKTKGQIPNVLEEPISSNTMLYLINTVMFDAEWNKIYKETEIVKNRDFTTENGEIQNATYMTGSEYGFIQTENATGFGKDYYGRDYEFVALLPNEGVTVSEVINSLTGESLQNALLNRENVAVQTGIPKFSFEYSVSLVDSLKSLGMNQIFNYYDADLSLMAETKDPTENLFVSEILHKTKITLDEKGTKAGAVTVVTTDKSESCGPETERKVYLDRPFVYMIIDKKENVPIFIGTLLNV